MGLYPLFFLVSVATGWIYALFRGPIWALMAYVFIYFNIPSHQWWGEQVPNVRWSFIAAGMILISSFLHRRELTKGSICQNRLGMILFFLLIWMSVIASFTPDPTLSWKKVYDFGRYILIFFLIDKIVVDFKTYRFFVSTILFGTFYIGVLAHHYFHGGRLDGVGLPDASDANMLAALVLLVWPLYIVFVFSEKGWRRLPPLIAFVLVINMFVMCGSRGAFVGFVVQGICAFVFLRRRIGFWKTTAFCMLSIICLFSLMSPQYQDRLLGLGRGLESSNSELENVSAGRTEIWKYGLLMARDYPLGAGGGAFQAMSPRYIPEFLLTGGERASHNTYLLVLVEEGIVGFILFLIFIIVQFIWPLKLLDRYKQPLYKLQKRGVYYHILAVLVGLAGFWTAAFFIDRVYFEGIYLVVALIPVLMRLLEEEIEKSNVVSTLA